MEGEYKEISFENEWVNSPPTSSEGQSLLQFINEVSNIGWKFIMSILTYQAADMQEYDAYHNYDDFRKRHWQLYQRAPYISPPNQRSWQAISSISL